MLSSLLNAGWITVHGLVALLAVTVFALGSRVRGQRRHPSAALAWVVSLALMPYVAIPLYLLFGNRKVVRGHARHRPPEGSCAGARPEAASGRTRQLAAAMGLAPPCGYQALAIHADGAEALRALHDLLQSATQSVEVCTFLLGRDATGDALCAALAGCVQRGVRVRLLIDGVGRYLGGRPDLLRLTRAGVQVAVFVSPFRSGLPGRTNLRNHRKLAIADGASTWTGGRNLAAEYFGEAPGSASEAPPGWIDLSITFSGDLAREAQRCFDADWAFATGGRAATGDPTREPHSAMADAEAQLIASGPDQADDTLYALLVSACFTAQSRISAVTPYFVPDALLMMALTLAARRGVRVDLVLPSRSNHRLADLARHAALRDLVAAGAHVWLVPQMVHAKAVLVDEDLALVGSANLDERSLFLNYELTIAFYAPADVARFGSWLDALRMRGLPYAASPPGMLRQLAEGMVRWVAFQL